MTHTPLPWQDPGEHEMTCYGDINHVLMGVDGKVIGALYANCFDAPNMQELPSVAEASANAALIVRTVNSYDRMVTALEMARRQLVTLGGEAGERPDADRIHAWVLTTIDEALEAAAPPVEQAKTEVEG